MEQRRASPRSEEEKKKKYIYIALQAAAYKY